MNADAWNPQQYERFKTERAQPFWDLLALVDVTGASRWLDVGCGSGELTRTVHESRHIPYTLGVDSSANMLKEAAAQKAEGLEFVQARIENFTPSAPFDVVFSNAALQWVPGHEELFTRLLTWLKPRGQLAVQMPVNFDHPSHTVAEEIAAKMGLTVRRSPVLAPEEYAGLLWKLGLRDVQVMMKVYLHPMPSAREVIEWTKGTLLTYYERQLDADSYREFLRQYAETFLLRTGEGPYLYPFKRLLIHGRLP